jgi:hypothetical protein
MDVSWITSDCASHRINFQNLTELSYHGEMMMRPKNGKLGNCDQHDNKLGVNIYTTFMDQSEQRIAAIPTRIQSIRTGFMPGSRAILLSKLPVTMLFNGDLPWDGKWEPEVLTRSRLDSGKLSTISHLLTPQYIRNASTSYICRCITLGPHHSPFAPTCPHIAHAISQRHPASGTSETNSPGIYR